jgi:hypothetical protein
MSMDLQFTGPNSVYPHLNNNNNNTCTCRTCNSFSLLKAFAYLWCSVALMRRPVQFFSVQRLAVWLKPWRIFSLTSDCTFSVCWLRIRLQSIRDYPMARGPQLANRCSTTFVTMSTYWLRRQTKAQTIGVTPRTYISKEHYGDGPKTMITPIFSVP